MFSQCLCWLESKPTLVRKFWIIQTKGEGHSPKILLFEGIIILVDLLGNRCLLKRVADVMLCDWWISIRSCFCGCLPFTRSFWKIRLESNWNAPFWVVPAENFWEQQNLWKACFSGWNIRSGNLCSISSKPSLIPVSGLRGCFPVNGTDLSKHDSGTKFTSTEVCAGLLAGDFPWLLREWPPAALILENGRKIEPKEIPSRLIPRLLVVFTQQLEILVTTLFVYHKPWTNRFAKWV